MQPGISDGLLILVLAALFCGLGPAPVGGEGVLEASAVLAGRLQNALNQVRAIWSFRSVCYPQSDSAMVSIITVVNGITNVPWGNQHQASGFQKLCNTTGVANCAGGGSRRRSLLQSSSSSSCPGDYWYLYLDTTQPVSGVWDGNSIINLVRTSMTNGNFVNSVAGTSVKADQIVLRYIDVANKTTPPPSPPPPSSPPPAPAAAPAPAASAVSPSPTPVPAPTPSSNTVQSSTGTTPGAPPESSGGGGSNKAAVIGGVIGGVVGLAVISALVGALILRRKSYVRAREKFQEDLAEHRAKRRGSRLGSDTSPALERISKMAEWDRQQRARVEERSKLGLGKKGSSTSISFTERAGSGAAVPAPGVANVSATPAHADDIEVPDDEFDTVLDANATRSSQAELPPQEKKMRLSIFGRKG
ncbi:hypothetical protein N2152v2_010129 [Parachlorella kessleri]